MDGGEHMPLELEGPATRAIKEGLDLLGFGVALFDAERRIIDANASVCRLLARSIDELRALPDPAAFVAPEHRSMIAMSRAVRAAGDAPPPFAELVLLDGEGTRVPAEFARVPVVLETGEPGLLAVIRDLRERDARDTQIEQYASLVERMPLGVLLWDTGGVEDPLDMRLVAANGAAVRTLGLDAEEVMGRTILEVFPAVRADDASRMLALVASERVEHFGDAPYRDEQRAGVYRWRAVALPGATVAAFFEDVTRDRALELHRRQLLERLVDTGDEERRHLAMAVHDDPVQQLAAATLLVEALRRHPDVDAREGRMAVVEEALRAAMSSLRRLVFELSPPELAESGLEAAVRSAADYLFADVPVVVSIQTDLRREPPAQVQTTAFRIASEALTNVRKHARASAVAVTITDRGQALELEVVDDGSGDEDALREEPGHVGIRSMRERAAALGGECRVVAADGGVRVTAVLPFEGRVVFAEAAGALLEPPPVGSSELETIRRERDSLAVAAAEARDRAALAEGRLREALNVTKAIVSPDLSADQVVDVAAERLARAAGDACAVHLFAADGASLVRAGSWHVEEQQLAFLDRTLFVDRPAEQGHTGTVLRSGEPLVLHGESLWLPSDLPRPTPPREPHSAIVVPLVFEHEVFGTVTVVRDRTRDRYDDIDVDFVQCLADRVAVALRLARRG